MFFTWRTLIYPMCYMGLRGRDSIIAQAYHLNPGKADLVDTELIQYLIFNKSWSPVADEISNIYIHLLSLTKWEGIDSGVHG